jgi:cytochrome c553
MRFLPWARTAAADVNGSIPRIAGQHYRVLVRQIIDFRYGKRWDARMEGVMAEHSVLAGNQDIADVAAYVSKLERDGARGVGDGQYVERGAAVVCEGCASCHGPRPRETKHAHSAARGPACRLPRAADLRRRGCAPVAAHRTHRKRFAPLVFRGRAGLTDYLARIGWSPPAETAR